MSRTPPQRRDENTSLRRLAILLRPYSRRLIMVVFMTIALAMFNMILPAYFIKLMIDDVFAGNGNIKLLWAILPGILVVYLARNLLYFFAKFSTVLVGENLCFTLRNRLFEQLQQMNLAFYRENKPGKISSRVMDDSFQVQTFIQDELPKLLQASFLFLGLVAVLYAVNWQLALASTIVLPLHLMVFLIFKQPIKNASRTAQEQLAIVHGNLIEKFLGAEVVKGFTAEDRENREFLKATDISRRSQLLSKKYHVTQKIIADLIVGLGTVALLGWGAWQVLGPSEMLPGIFFAFFALVRLLYPTVLELMSGFAKLAKCSASIDRVFEMLESTDGEGGNRGQLLPAVRGELRFDSVSFAYKDGPPVLKNVNLHMKPGQVCAIVGPSGAGKSTLVSLVPRFNEPDLGFIELDGVRLDQLDVRNLREAVGIAFQECFLFSSSILENLLYARPEASMKQVIEVAKRTGAHAFIMKLPDGYDTVMGEEGISLSRGEKQRVNLTRAMLKNPKILILDEATASIDIASESQIIPNILEFMRGKTTLMITHRPELLQHADMVVYIEDGRIKYEGPVSEMPDLDLGISPFEAETIDETEPRRKLSDPGSGGAGETGGGGGGFLGMLLAAAICAASMLVPVSPVMAQAAVIENAGKLIATSGMSEGDVTDLLDLVIARLQVEQGFTISRSKGDLKALPSTKGLRGEHVLTKSSEKQVTLLQLGYKSFRSQPPHIWVYGITIPTEGEAKPADPVATVVKLIEEGKKSREAAMASRKASDLATEKIILSHVEAARCTKMLKSFGYTVGIAGTTVDPKALPVILEMPSTTFSQLPKSVTVDFPATASDPINEIIVFYNPAQPEQFSGVLDKVRNIIDVPARQIIISAMVLEISETGLDRLGVEWELRAGHDNLSELVLGQLPGLTAVERSVSLTAPNVFGEFEVTLHALIKDGIAEVLSRPHVLTLDNRMANIAITRTLPIVNSITNPNASTVTVSFRKEITGITLNVRPHASHDGEEVAMQIVAQVSDRVPGEDVVVFNSIGDEVARSPTIAKREIKATVRVANNTPFIIGGLVAKVNIQDTEKVPVLGDLPWVGPFFRSDRIESEKREVIVVITPFLLPQGRVVSRVMPLDKDSFDSFGDQLFRSAYRIRAEDVFDLRFLTDNLQVRQMQILAKEVASKNAELGRQYPFDRFAGGRIPGERILVYRQMYEVIKRRKIEDDVNLDRLIFFQGNEQSESGFDVEFLTPFLHKQAGGEFTGFKGKALALTYTLQKFNDRARGILSQPVPKISLVDCADREEWGRLLWELNQPGKDGNERYTILIQNHKDLTRLKRAIVLKHTVELNVHAGVTPMLKHFTVGRELLVPNVKPDKVYLIDEEVAKYFFYTEQYYPAVRQELERDIQALKVMLKDPQVTPHLTDPSVVDRPLPWVPPLR